MIGYDAADILIVGEMFHFYNRYYQLCVEGEEKSPCSGDSGGPLICEGIYWLGRCSFFLGCMSKKCSVYAW